MSVIHQLYCTHCTYRTSALHRRDDSIGDQVFEYSTRAGSVPREKSHDVFRLIEPALYFHLPGDTPQTEFMRFTANTSPRRLFFLPAISGTRVVAHVCYRQTDTRGRPGSYFAHVFSSENKSGANWSALDAIMLWGSPHWITEDSANLPYDLSDVESLTTIPGHGTHVNESVLRSFLTTPANGFFSDPGKVIPPQWRERDPQQRRQLLIDLLSAALCVEVDRHEKVWLAAEESFAALLFYGVFRLLPPKGLVDKLSFSTFEAHTDRPSAALVATRFHKPETDFAEDAYKGRGVVINTFNGRRSLALRPAVYAATVVQRFLAPDGSRQVNELLQRLAEANVSQGKELEQLLAAEELIPQIVSPPPGVTVTERQLPSGREARKIVQRGVVKALYAGTVFSPQLRQIAQSPERVSLLIELLSGCEIPEAEAILRQLLQFIPTDGFVRLMPDKRISRQQKLDLIAKVVRETKSLPPGYESLWSSRPELGWPDKMLEGLFSQLSCDDVRPLLDSAFTVVPGSSTETMDRLRTTVSGFLVASASDPAKRDLLPPIVERLAAEPSRLQSFLLMPEIGAQLVSQCGLVGPIATCLQDTLEQLPREPGRFVERLRLLQLGQNLPLGDGWLSRFNAWQSIRRRLGNVEDLLQNRPGRISSLFNNQHQKDLESCRQGLLTDSLRAMPFDDFPEDHSGRDRARLLKRIVEQLVPSDGLPPDFLDLEPLAAPVSQRPYSLPPSPTPIQPSRLPSLLRHAIAITLASLLLLVLIVGIFAPHVFRRFYDEITHSELSERMKREDSTTNRPPVVKKESKENDVEDRIARMAKQQKEADDDRDRMAQAEKEKTEKKAAEDRIARMAKDKEKKTPEERNKMARENQDKKDITDKFPTFVKLPDFKQTEAAPPLVSLPNEAKPELRILGCEEVNKTKGDKPDFRLSSRKEMSGAIQITIIKPKTSERDAATHDFCTFELAEKSGQNGIYIRYNYKGIDQSDRDGARNLLESCFLAVETEPRKTHYIALRDWSDHTQFQRTPKRTRVANYLVNEVKYPTTLFYLPITFDPKTVEFNGVTLTASGSASDDNEFTYDLRPQDDAFTNRYGPCSFKLTIKKKTISTGKQLELLVIWEAMSVLDLLSEVKKIEKFVTRSDNQYSLNTPEKIGQLLSLKEVAKGFIGNVKERAIFKDGVLDAYHAMGGKEKYGVDDEKLFDLPDDVFVDANACNTIALRRVWIVSECLRKMKAKITGSAEPSTDTFEVSGNLVCKFGSENQSFVLMKFEKRTDENR